MSSSSLKTSRLVAGLVACSLLLCAGCGGGDSSTTASGPLAFRVLWPQSSATGASRLESGRETAAFGTTIPAAVNTVRITLTPRGTNRQPACCVAIRRGTQTFANRSLTLSALPAGEYDVGITGFPTDFAPADGVGRRCATVPMTAAEACDQNRRQLASFDGAPAPVTVEPGKRADAGTIVMRPLPFLLGLQPAPQASVVGPQVPVRFVVVTAVDDIVSSSVSVSVSPANARGAGAFNLGSSTACDDDGPTPCSTGGSLDVQGLLIDGTTSGLPPGPATVAISASNDGTPRQNLDYSYSITVLASASSTTTTTSTTTTSTTLSATTTTVPATTTTLPSPTTTLGGTASTTTTTSTTTSTSSMTSSTSSTTTTVPVTTTTLPGGSTTTSTLPSATTTTTSTTVPAPGCTVSFGLLDAISLSGLGFSVDYSLAPGTFPGAADQVQCQTNPALSVVGAFNNDRPNSTLIVGIVSFLPFTGPVTVADCHFAPSATPTAGDFTITLNEAIAPDLSQTTATVGVTGIACTP